MKIWSAYGSEHSANLVMIGHFKNVDDAAQAKRMIGLFTEQVNLDAEARIVTGDGGEKRYTHDMLSLMRSLNQPSIGPGELEQFTYEMDVTQEEARLIVTTEEIDVSAIIKLFLNEGAHVEMYSRHDYPETPSGHGV